MSRPIQSFDKMIAPVSPDAFFAERWEKQPLHIRRGNRISIAIC